MKKQMGYIGLGKMGKNMVLRLLEHGWEIVATDANPQAVADIKNSGAQGVSDLAILTDKLDSPRLLWLMVPHQVVDTVLEELMPLLEEGDVVIDGGNSNYKETLRRASELEAKGIKFMDAGISGGPAGARNGACSMVGGSKELFENNEELFKDISAPESYGRMGRTGAGHFVKMVHNGIEYGMMQAIGEGFGVMKKSDFDLDLQEVTRVYNHNSVIESRLVGWLQSAFEQEGVDLEAISGKVSHSGEGLWTVEVAKELNISVPIIEGSLTFREESQKNPSYIGKVVSALRNQFGGHEVSKKQEL